MRTYARVPFLALIPLLALPSGCGLWSIEPDEIDVADEVGEADDVGDTADDDGTADDGIDTGSTGEESEGTGTDTSNDTDDDTSDATSEGTEDADTSTTDESDTSEDTSTDSGTTEGGACELNPDDDLCVECVKTECCEPLEACQADADCQCVATCVTEGGLPDACIQECEGGADLFVALASCTAMNCVAQCEP